MELGRYFVWRRSLDTKRLGGATCHPCGLWVESPLDSQLLFVIPMVMQWEYGRVNTHVQLVGQFHPLPHLCGMQPNTVPFLSFHLPCFLRTLSTECQDLDQPTSSQPPLWVLTQEECVCGMSPDDRNLDWWSILMQFLLAVQTLWSAVPPRMYCVGGGVRHSKQGWFYSIPSPHDQFSGCL
jgi:hypothetical protein